MIKDGSLLVPSLVWSVCGEFALCMVWLFLLQILLADLCDFLYIFVLSAPASDADPATVA